MEIIIDFGNKEIEKAVADKLSVTMSYMEIT